MNKPFRHGHFAHCESGVATGLLRHHGIEVSEPFVFGVGSGLFFLHFPLAKIYGMPMTSFRAYPGGVIRRASKRLGIRLESVRFRNPDRGMRRLDDILERGIPVGLQVDIFWLPYIPVALRFHFNAHNLVVYGKEGDDYLISDPVLEEPVICSATNLRRARFAAGALAPRGRMYHPVGISGPPDFAQAAACGLKDVRRRMIGFGPRMLGVRGIRYLAARLAIWPQKFGPRRTRQMLAWVVRMQEEIGTGGAGFRFLFAAFLQEAAERVADERLRELSESMTAAGDRWREFALIASRVCKDRIEMQAGCTQAHEILLDCADREYRIYSALKKAGY